MLHCVPSISIGIGPINLLYDKSRKEFKLLRFSISEGYDLKDFHNIRNALILLMMEIIYIFWNRNKKRGSMLQEGKRLDNLG